MMSGAAALAPGNAWVAAGPSLRDAFLRSGGTLTLALLLHDLLPLLPDDAAVLDFGGGDGRLALALASHGAHVTLIDADPQMRAAAEAAAAAHPEGGRLTILAGGVEALAGLRPRYHLVCCHSVLMYLPDAQPLVAGLAGACRPGGHVSLVSLNPAAAAMRAGLQQRWGDALSAITGAGDGADVPTYPHSPEAVSALFAAHGFEVWPWRGVGIFTDHYRGPVEVDRTGLEKLLQLEQRAGVTEPYRSVARCFHLVASRAK
jgi:S-adenosylmethionine-dependent methyltransferase